MTDEQQPLVHVDSMATSETALRVPGTNNATYGPVPKTEQIFYVEFLEIAPSPVPVNEIFFIWLRGQILPSWVTALDTLNDAWLANATLAITSWAIYPDRERMEPTTYTIPLRTKAYADFAHIAVRDAAGAHVDHLTISGANDILADMLILGPFLRTGEWTFEIVAKLADGTCLFAMSLTQWLKGNLH
ncbi:hypothetical protein LTR50_004420 [Elasticomyces elasticus]|nr:hypothetical protein LTR50_004420 [Elasticomyces elasticus]